MKLILQKGLVGLVVVVMTATITAGISKLIGLSPKQGFAAGLIGGVIGIVHFYVSRIRN